VLEGSCKGESFLIVLVSDDEWERYVPLGTLMEVACGLLLSDIAALFEADAVEKMVINAKR
jgi:hypothetical protein